MNGNDDVSINTAIARRATLKEKKSGGTRIHSFPFRTIISEDKTFLEGIYAIRDLQNQYFPSCQLRSGRILCHQGKGMAQRSGTDL